MSPKKRRKQSTDALIELGVKCVEAWSATFAAPRWRFVEYERSDPRFWTDGKDGVGRDFAWSGLLAWSGNAAPVIADASEKLMYRLLPLVQEALGEVDADEDDFDPVPSALAQDLARGFIGEAFSESPVFAQTRALDCWASGLVLGTWDDSSGQWPVARYRASAPKGKNPSFELRWSALGATRDEVNEAIAALDSVLGRAPIDLLLKR